jgi:tRNA modification GTPase
LGIVRTSGSGTLEQLSKIFSRPKALLEAQGHTLVYGWIVDTGNRIDEVLIAVYRAPRSFTGEEMAEIICHGGPAVVTAVFELLLRSGFRQAEGGEFTFRGFINGKTDLTRAEAVREIIDAKTDTGREHAVGRLAGNLHAELTRIKGLIIQALAAAEVEIEYPEEDHADAGVFDTTAVEEVCTLLEELAAGWEAQKLYQEGAKVVLCGRTNAGKSSLFNMLLKEERAIVSDIHGTTRDWLESWASFNGIPVRLFDTAGLRETSDTIEAAGVERSQGLASEADLILYVVDSAEGLNGEDKDFIAGRGNLLLVGNKADRLQAERLQMEQAQTESSLLEGSIPSQALLVSAKAGSGIPALVDHAAALLASRAASGHGSRSRSSTGLSSAELRSTELGTARQRRIVEEALASLRHAVASAKAGYPLDAIAQDLEDAVTALGEITGEVTSDDILDAVFSGFCVGK